ncbi:MAG: hypothetical protein UU63_C0064G0004 [Candidatus Uhrbacteria bacterium GW2011_GWF2_41_430]|nr:MAG: hypothetical protein UU63_C0064G0004 [Candidatus Uhrbacteria bacterium GW2011_GWF2_41_430]
MAGLIAALSGKEQTDDFQEDNGPLFTPVPQEEAPKFNAWEAGKALFTNNKSVNKAVTNTAVGTALNAAGPVGKQINWALNVYNAAQELRKRLNKNG